MRHDDTNRKRHEFHVFGLGKIMVVSVSGHPKLTRKNLCRVRVGPVEPEHDTNFSVSISCQMLCQFHVKFVSISGQFRVQPEFRVKFVSISGPIRISCQFRINFVSRVNSCRGSISCRGLISCHGSISVRVVSTRDGFVSCSCRGFVSFSCHWSSSGRRKKILTQL